jgi:hypothetical protein
MYNLFVTAVEGAWDGDFYELPRSRFLEYTSDSVAARFQDLNEAQIRALVRLPCLFTYEGTDSPVSLGRLRSVRVRERQLLVEPEIDRATGPIDFERIKPIQTLLDIRGWEMSRTHWAVKDEDLFAALRRIGVHPQGPGAQEEPLPPLSPASISIETVGQFIQTVLDLPHGDKETFYRGHSHRTKYRLEPSLFRKDDEGNPKYADAEDRMFRELLVSNSGDFQGDIYTLDRLVRMQHYSLPTRLLDITTNPLIALYFACKSNPGHSGEVIVFAMDGRQIKYFDSDTASCLANLARLPSSDKEAIDFSLDDIATFNNQLPIKRLLHFIKEEKAFFEPRIDPKDLRRVICVKGKHTNDRIAFQSGAFLLFGQDAILDEQGTPEIEVQRIEITAKEAVLGQLDRLNINESTVFPYIENSAKYIAQRYSFHG